MTETDEQKIEATEASGPAPDRTEDEAGEGFANEPEVKTFDAKAELRTLPNLN